MNEQLEIDILIKVQNDTLDEVIRMLLRTNEPTAAGYVQAMKDVAAGLAERLLKEPT